MNSFLPLPWFARRSIRQRTQEIAATLARHGLGWLVVQVGLGDLLPFQRGWLGHPVREAPYTQAEHLRMALADLGATFIKLGQALSTRPDLFPPEYVAELSKLQDAAPPVPFEQIRQMVYDELGEWPDHLFAAFDPLPLAVASIGQAHAAQTKDGQAVIVKVQRPGVAEQVERDLGFSSRWPSGPRRTRLSGATTTSPRWWTSSPTHCATSWTTAGRRTTPSASGGILPAILGSPSRASTGSSLPTAS
jgi:hypothetical protein